MIHNDPNYCLFKNKKDGQNQSMLEYYISILTTCLVFFHHYTKKTASNQIQQPKLPFQTISFVYKILPNFPERLKQIVLIDIRLMYSFNFILFCNLHMHHRAEYRIRGQKKTEDDFDEQIEQQLRLSTHAKGQKRENSAVLSRKHQESSQNSRLVDSRANSRIGSSVLGSRVGRVLRNSRTDKNGVVDIQFNNVRWISIVSAYDSKRLKNVTVSKQSCETFLKRYGTGIKNDAAAMALFKDIKRHFQSWLGRINEAFSDVIDDFLRVSERAPLQNFKQMEPVLESISKDTYMMGQKLEGCLKIYENNDFRRLFTRFQNFNVFSSKLEDLIKGIYQSKHRIDELFSELQNVEDERIVDKKVDKIIKKGVREAESIIEEVNGYNHSIRDRIISKVKLAINDMADKSLNLFHKVQGAKDLIRRLHKLIADSRRSLQSSEIRKISKIFKAIIQQANKFQDFVSHFNAEQDHISPKLREKLNEYSENIEQQKRAVSEIQILFVQTVINETIQTLKSSFTLNNVLSPSQQKIQYNEFNHTLQEISDAMLDQTSRGCVEGLIKHGKSNFSKLDDELQKIKRIFRKNEGIIFIDTENGEIQIMEYCNLADKYKTKIKNLISKHEEALKNLGIYYRQARLSDNERDPELIYLKDIRKVVEVVNGKQRNDSFAKQKALYELNNNGNILTYGTEVTQAYNLMQEMYNNKKQTTNFNQTNPLKNLIRNVRFENQFYLEAAYILECYEIINRTNEKNLIQNLTKLTETNSKRQHQLQDNDGYKTTKPYCYLLDRLYCLCLIKGLKKPTIKQFDDNKAIVFPQTEYDAKQMENELKYRTLIVETIGDGGSYSKNKIKAALKVIKDMISSFRIIEKLNNNSNGQYIILVQALSAYSVQYFKILISNEDLNDRGVQCKKIILQCVKSLKAKLSNIDLVDQQIDMETADAALKARNKILKIQALNQKALTSLQQTSKKSDYLEMFSGFIFPLTQYIEQSKQLVYIALNEFKQPIWFNSISSAKDGITAQIDLKGYRRGTFVDQYVRQAPIVRKVVQKIQQNAKSPTKSPEGKEKNFVVRQKSHQKQSMDEEMAIESDKQMEEDIGDNIEEDNIQEINDDMAQEINDIDDNMEEEINEIEDGIQEIDDKLVEDIDEEVIQSMSPKKNKNKPKEQEKQSPKKEVAPQKQKIEAKKTSQVSVYEIIPHFKQLEQIRSMFLLIDSTETAFWSNQVDYDELQDFFHRPQDLKDRTNFIKSLESCFSMFINSRFEKGISDEIKRLDRFTSLKQKFNSLGQKSWVILFKVLSSIDFSYSLLLANKSQKQEIIQIKISRKNNQAFKKQGSKLILQNFLARKFKSSFYRAEKFNIDDYLSNCFKVDTQQCLNSAGDGFHYVIKVIPQYKEALPESQTHSQMLSLEKIQETFNTNLVTGIDLRALLIQFWVKAICPDAQEYYKPDYSTLTKYIKTLDYVDKKEWIGHYLIEFRQNILKIRDKIKSHKNLIDNTLFKVDSSNVWQCIKSIYELYEKKIKYQTVYVTSNQRECIVYATCEDSAIGVTSQSKLSTFLQDLFNKSDKKQPKVILTQGQIISTIGKQYEKDESSFQMHESITNLLNIMEIQHFYATQPEIIFKSNLDEVVFTVLKNLNIKNKTQIDYQGIFKDLFEHKKSNFSNILTLKKKIDRNIFTDTHIKQINNRLKDIAKQSKYNEQNFKATILNCQMSLVMFDSLSNKQSKPQQAVKEYFSWLKQIEQEFSSQLTSRLFNLLNYVTEKKKQITSLQQSISKRLFEIEPLTKCRNQSSKGTKIIEQVGNLLRSLSKWMNEKGYASNSSLFSIKTDENSWVFSLQFAKKDPQQHLKQYFTKYLLTNNDNRKEAQKLFAQFYKKCIESKVKIINNDKTTEINYEISKLPLQLSHEIREDLVQIEDMLTFTRYYNQHRFNTNPSILKKLEETHTKLINRMKSKLFLVQLKDLINKCKWNGLQKLQAFKELFECFATQLTYQKDYLLKLIETTDQIGVRETDLKSYIDWFKLLGINELKLQYYILKSSQKNIITIFPVAKIDKDKSKSSEDIKKFLADIKLPPKYTVALEQGVSTIYLQKEIVKCHLSDSEHFLTEQNQLNNFQSSIPEGQILLLSYYQGTSENQKTPLMMGELKLETQCVLNIKQYETSSTITCSIWKIAKSDYEQWKSSHEKPDEESFRQLRKKMRGLATSQQRIRDVCVGQDVNFTETGAWLRQELKKHNKRVQQLKRAEQERKRIEALTIAQSEQFLVNVYKDMLDKESLPTLNVTFDQAKKFRNEEALEPTETLTAYWKKIMDSTKKVIEKIEESKSSEQINRISALTKDFIKMVKIKLVQNQKVQVQMMKQAKEAFSVVEKQREIKEQQRRKEKLQRAERKQKEKEEKLKKKLAQQAKKLLQAAAAPANNPDPVGPSTTQGQEVKPAQLPQEKVVQQLQQEEPEVKVQEEQVDECDLILEFEGFQQVKKGKEEELYMSYLIFLLETQPMKDAEYYRCILRSFWKQTLKNREALALLK